MKIFENLLHENVWDDGNSQEEPREGAEVSESHKSIIK